MKTHILYNARERFIRLLDSLKHDIDKNDPDNVIAFETGYNKALEDVKQEVNLML